MNLPYLFAILLITIASPLMSQDTQVTISGNVKGDIAELNEDIHFIDKGESISSLNELIGKFQGKQVYVDVWATWCGPCKKEFAYNQELKKLLAENDTEILYISVDREDRMQQWKDMVNYYDLKGHHIRVNKALEQELRTLFDKGGSVEIPWYILFDKQGKLLELYAPRPSQLKKLEKKL